MPSRLDATEANALTKRSGRAHIGDMRSDEIKIFAGNSNKPLADAVSRALEQPLGRSRVTRFSDGEIQVEIDESVRGQHTFVLQSTSPPANRLYTASARLGTCPQLMLETPLREQSTYIAC